MIERLVALAVVPWWVASATGWAFWVGVHTLLSPIEKVGRFGGLS